MSLLHHFNTIRLEKNLHEKVITITELIGFNMDDETRKALSDAEDYCKKIVSEGFSKSQSDINKVRSSIISEIRQKQHSNYSKNDLENLATQFLSANTNSFICRDLKTERLVVYHKTKAIQKDYDLVLSIAKQLIEVQQSYLFSHNWMDKKKLTYLQLAAQHPQCSEATIRRRIQSLNLTLNNWRFPASYLLCANDLPYVCKQITRILKKHPNAGRPTLYRILHDEGYDFSDRQIGNALKLLQKAKQTLKLMPNF